MPKLPAFNINQNISTSVENIPSSRDIRLGFEARGMKELGESISQVGGVASEYAYKLKRTEDANYVFQKATDLERELDETRFELQKITDPVTGKLYEKGVDGNVVMDESGKPVMTNKTYSEALREFSDKKYRQYQEDAPSETARNGFVQSSKNKVNNFLAGEQSWQLKYTRAGQEAKSDEAYSKSLSQSVAKDPSAKGKEAMVYFARGVQVDVVNLFKEKQQLNNRVFDPLFAQTKTIDDKRKAANALDGSFYQMGEVDPAYWDYMLALHVGAASGSGGSPKITKEYGKGYMELSAEEAKGLVGAKFSAEEVAAAEKSGKKIKYMLPDKTEMEGAGIDVNSNLDLLASMTPQERETSILRLRKAIEQKKSTNVSWISEYGNSRYQKMMSGEPITKEMLDDQKQYFSLMNTYIKDPRVRIKMMTIDRMAMATADQLQVMAQTSKSKQKELFTDAKQAIQMSVKGELERESENLPEDQKAYVSSPAFVAEIMANSEEMMAKAALRYNKELDKNSAAYINKYIPGFAAEYKESNASPQAKQQFIAKSIAMAKKLGASSISYVPAEEASMWKSKLDAARKTSDDEGGMVFSQMEQMYGKYFDEVYTQMSGKDKELDSYRTMSLIKDQTARNELFAMLKPDVATKLREQFKSESKEIKEEVATALEDYREAMINMGPENVRLYDRIKDSIEVAVMDAKARRQGAKYDDLAAEMVKRYVELKPVKVEDGPAILIPKRFADDNVNSAAIQSYVGMGMTDDLLQEADVAPTKEQLEISNATKGQKLSQDEGKKRWREYVKEKGKWVTSNDNNSVYLAVPSASTGRFIPVKDSKGIIIKRTYQEIVNGQVYGRKSYDEARKPFMESIMKMFRPEQKAGERTPQGEAVVE
jgi:hypothetical protein